MKKLIYLLVFCPFLGFSQDGTNNVDCDANDIMKEIYQEGNRTIMKCTDANGNFVLTTIYIDPNGGAGSGGSGNSGSGGNSGGNSNGNGNSVDTGMSEYPGPEGSGSTGGGCINTWVKDNGKWQQTAYCGGQF